ncbi:MAG TPA: SUMF1/EgtB/PvdO family nonheme iron enzyme, partial [Polyangiaceae bacterium]|nr:SUMF1/EgtB/PvdO family nonheme iron enzyme [Polyangiaceae bacterium]
MRSDAESLHKSTVRRGSVLFLCLLLLLGCNKLLGLQGGTVQAACTTDAQCAPGYGCLEKLGCRNRCTADSDCGAGSRCFKAFVTTACIPVTEGCTVVDADSGTGDGCPKGTSCDGSVCRTQCDSTSTSTSTSADRCAGGQECVGGACVSKDPSHENASGGAGGMSGGGAGGASEVGVGGSGGAAPDLCAGVTCNTPPANDCNGGAEFDSYDKTGSCANGTCSYTSHTIACTCQSGACTTDPCIAVTCASPPAAACTGTDGNTLTTYSASGTCSAGSCSYTPTNKACTFGCVNGACKPDPCAGVTCNMPTASGCKNATTATTYAATGTCSAGICSYAPTDTGCGSNKLCSGAGVCSECKTDSSCGATCAACGGGTPKCKNLGTTSQCVGCLSNADCGGVTPSCNTTTNVCGPAPSCVGLAATCGPSGNASCCASSVVTGGTFNRNIEDVYYPATVSDFRLDTYEVTVGRFRKFVAAYSQTMIPQGAGKNPKNPSDAGWDASWNASLDTDATTLTAALKCYAPFQTWVDTAGTAASESLPIDCLDWFEAEAFCIWDGGRLPTEAEWNYAAAGGTDQREYPWSNPATSTA